MIHGVGIDVIEVDRIKRELSKPGESFCKKIFTEEEDAYCRRGSTLDVRAQRFAGRFCAKEAFFKAVGTGLRDGLRWKDVEVLNNALGKPEFVLKGEALEAIQKETISNVRLSITHSRGVAAAVVVLEK